MATMQAEMTDVVLATLPPKRAGFGRAFVDLFHELGYDGSDLHVDSFEWLFGLPSMRVQAFLDWFLTSVRPRQSVKRRLPGAQDYAIYIALVHGEIGDGILTGDALARAELACQSDRALQTEQEDDSLDALNAANAKLEREIELMERRLRVASERNDRLTSLVQHNTLDVDRQTQRHQHAQDKAHFSELLHQLQPPHRSRKQPSPTPDQLRQRIHEVLYNLTAHSSDASSFAARSSLDHALVPAQSSLLVGGTFVPQSARASALTTLTGENQRPREFLFQRSLEQLEAAEERNLQELKRRIPAISVIASSAVTSTASHTTTHHDDDASDVSMSPAPKARRNDPVPPPPSPWLHESDPGNLNLHEQDALLYNKCCVELERLRQAFVVGERDALLAQMQVTGSEYHLRQLTTSRRSLLQQFQLMSRDAIWARRRILQASLDKTKRQIRDLLQSALPEKLEELAYLKSTTILLQSYEHKLWRQEHRFLKLRSLLEGFESQHARLKLAHRLLDAERQDLLKMEEIFEQLTTHLRQVNDFAEQRIDAYDTTLGSDAARDTLSRTYLDEHDNVAHQLFATLEKIVHGDGAHGPDGQVTRSHRLRTFDELVRLCEAKQANEQSLEESMQLLRREWQQLFESKRATLTELRVALFGEATSSTPMLLPTDVSALLHHATASKDNTEQALHDAMETLRLHKRAIQVEPTTRMQQEQNYARLRREVDERR